MSGLADILDRIEARLSATCLSAAAASEKAGLSKDAIRNIQRTVAAGQEHGVSTRTLSALAPVLDTTASWLLDGAEPLSASQNALTPRDWFAGHALAGMLAGGTAPVDDNEHLDPLTMDSITRDAYRYADFMLAERAKGGA